MALAAETSVTAAVATQVRMDAPRTFMALSPGCCPQGPREDAEACLCRVLMAFEWRNANAQVRNMGASYTQGMSYLAATCLGLCGWDQEELGFLLYARLVEDVLGLEYFYEWPPLIGFHTDAHVAPSMARAACPVLARTLGEALEDVVAMLAVRLLVPCFVVSSGLQEANLLSLWAELLDGRAPAAGPVGCISCSAPVPSAGAALPRLPLLVWFVGVLRALEPDAVAAVATLAPEERGVAAVGAVLKGLARLPTGWRPGPLPQPPSVAAEELARARRRLMHGARLQATQKLGLPLLAVERLHAEFLALPQAGPEEGIDAETVQELLNRIAPARAGHAEELFNLLDRDGSRSLDFFELMAGVLALAEGTLVRKLELLFRLYDTDDSGALEIDELHCLATTLVKLAKAGSSKEEPAAVLPQRGATCEDADSVTCPPAPKPRPTVPRHLRRQRTCASQAEVLEADRIRRRLLLMLESGDRELRQAMILDSNARLSLEEWRIGVLGDPVIMQMLGRSGITGAPGEEANQDSPGLDSDRIDFLSLKMGGKGEGANCAVS